MTPKEWYASRDAAHERLVARESQATDEDEVQAAREEWSETRMLLRWWALDQPRAWRERFEEIRCERVLEVLDGRRRGGVV